MPIDLLALDIGGVLATREKLPKNFNFLFDKDFDDLQRGAINPGYFLAKKSFEKDKFKNLIKINANITLLAKLSCPYVFASNINILHYEKFISASKISSFALNNSLLSYELGAIKPENIFFELLKKLNLRAQNILFIDDKLENIRAAQKHGLSTWWCEKPHQLSGYLARLNLLSSKPKDGIMLESLLRT